jgi:hypothetical protein
MEELWPTVFPAWTLIWKIRRSGVGFILVNRGDEINPGVWSDIWPVTLDKPLPLLPIPLEPPDPDVLLDMNAVVRTIYEHAAYERRINYRQPVPPALRPAMVQWVQAHLAAA